MNAISEATSVGLYNEHLAIILGYLTLFSALAVLASCRIVPSLMRLWHKDPLQSHFYQSFYKWHAYFWWAFGMGLVLHAMTAFFHTGLPDPGDPDAPIHWAILILALGSAFFLFMVFISCRSTVTFLNFMDGTNPLGNRLFKWFYVQHGLYWWPFVLLFLAHIAVAYAHVGIWPEVP